MRAADDAGYGLGLMATESPLACMQTDGVFGEAEAAKLTAEQESSEFPARRRHDGGRCVAYGRSAKQVFSQWANTDGDGSVDGKPPGRR